MLRKFKFLAILTKIRQAKALGATNKIRNKLKLPSASKTIIFLIILHFKLLYNITD